MQACHLAIMLSITATQIYVCSWIIQGGGRYLALGRNFNFATKWEKILWRSSGLSVWGLLCVYGSTEMAICYREGYAKPGLESGRAYKMRWPHCLMFLIPATLYAMARLGLIVVALSSMTSLPSEVFQDVQWTSLLPHI